MHSSFIFALLLVLCIAFTSVYAHGSPNERGKKGVKHTSESGADSSKGKVTSATARRRRKRSSITGLLGTATGAAAAPATKMLGGVTGVLNRGNNAQVAAVPQPEASI